MLPPPYFRSALILALAALLLAAPAVPLAAVLDADPVDEDDLSERGIVLPDVLPAGSARPSPPRCRAVFPHASPDWERPPPPRPIA